MEPLHRIILNPIAHKAYGIEELSQLAAQKAGLKVDNYDFLLLKRSVDARKTPIKWNYSIGIYPKGEKPDLYTTTAYQKVSEQSPTAHIIGTGPAGLFAALRLLESGIKPILLERGKDVKKRRRDLVSITRNHDVNSDSNYCYGEGGAGTYSDGKLYTRSKKRGSIQKILGVLVQHGSTEDILIDSHPHIGTNKLPRVIEDIRATILENGGEVHFESKVTNWKIEGGSIHSLELNHDKWIPVEKVILATGHSARDIFELLHKSQIKIEAKPFAVGFRIEHQQKWLDQCQYRVGDRPSFLPAASYSLVTQVNDRGVFSFCMCPGGIVAPCATSNGEVVTNGWSPSKRDNETCNAGIVTQVSIEDLEKWGFKGPLAGVNFQKDIEKKSWEMAGKTQAAPAQLAKDFLKGKLSTQLPERSSYIPGIVSSNITQLFPRTVTQSLQAALKTFNQKMKGFAEKDALIIAPETRTSSPVRIPRDKISLQHPEIKNLYPCGEGAGYAGGIISAAIDGENCAEAIVKLQE